MNRIYTIGHSTRALDELVSLLREHQVIRLADVRRYPVSRRFPHFSRDSLERSLPSLGILYDHFEDLGGRRKSDPGSPNGAWENEQFRGYADYMGTAGFRAAVDRLVKPDHSTAVMCAEAVPWRCHRNLVADELLRRGMEVLHVIGPGAAKSHELSKMALFEPDRVTYPPRQGTIFPH